MLKPYPSVPLVACLVLAATPVHSQQVIFDGFENTDGLTFNNDALVTTTPDGSVARLSSAAVNRSGSLFSTLPVSTAEFTSIFSFRISNSGGPILSGNDEGGADGLVFVVQNQANNVGSVGEGIGYRNIAPSLGIEFDTFFNASNNDPSQSHVGIDLNGNVDHAADGQGPTVNIGDVPSGSINRPGPELDDGDRWWAWAINDGEQISLFLTLNESSVVPERPSEPLLTFDVDLEEVLGGTSAFVGFTSATGSNFSDHDLLFFSYDNVVPEPSTLGLLAVSSGLLFRRREGRDRFATVSRAGRRIRT